MPKHLRTFAWGMIISFLGSLPLGTLNVAAMQIAITDGLHPAILFSIGCLLVEIVYVRLSLIAMDWVRKQHKIFKMLEWLTVLIVAALAASSFYAALHPYVNKNVILSSTLNRFILGVLMSAVNPVQIPFWFGWSTVLFSKKILIPQSSYYNIYILGIGLGTAFASCIFVFGGRFVGEKISSNQNILNWVIGGIFALTAVIQLWRIMKKKDAHHTLEHPEELTQKLEKQIERLDNE